MKNCLLLAVFLSVLCSCKPYSDEMMYYYEDENASPEASAAPTKSVSSEDLITPPSMQEDMKEEIVQETTIKEDIKVQEEVVEIPVEKTQKKIEQDAKSEPKKAQDLIPVTYGKTVAPDFDNKTQPEFSNDSVSPKVYAIVATRGVNKMLDQTQNLYQEQNKKPKLLIQKAEKLNTNLPDGFNYANKTIYDIVNGSQNYMLVDKLDDADFVLESSFDAKANPNMPSPIIIFNLSLKDKDGKVIDSWQESIKQVENDDQSWW